MIFHRRIFALCLLLVAVCGNVILAAEPLIVAHRGLLMHAPENTLANFRACLELRLGFEFDVQRTSDGHLVCLHDDTLDRTTNGTGKVSDYTLAKIKQLDAGSWFDPKFAGEKIPTIDEVLSLVAEYKQHNILVAVDFKASGVEQEVVRMAEQKKILHRLIFIGRTISDASVRQNILATSPNAQAAVLANNAEEFPRAIADLQASWVYVRFVPTKEQVLAARQVRKKVFIAGATVAGNVPTNWQLAANAGVDGVLTDFPLELRTAIAASRPSDWQSLFNGKTLDGWDAEDLMQCFRVEDNAIVAGGGPLARLSYVGPVNKHNFKNFELKVEVKTTPGSNGGVFFHTGPQKTSLKKGYEVQVCNSCCDNRKTGSLLVAKDIAESPAKDNQWFEYHVTVTGKRIVVKVNGQVTVDYTEPDSPKRPATWEQRVLSDGLIALQAHDANSTVYYRNIRVKVLPD